MDVHLVESMVVVMADYLVEQSVWKMVEEMAVMMVVRMVDC